MFNGLFRPQQVWNEVNETSQSKKDFWWNEASFGRLDWCQHFQVVDQYNKGNQIIHSIDIVSYRTLRQVFIEVLTDWFAIHVHSDIYYHSNHQPSFLFLSARRPHTSEFTFESLLPKFWDGNLRLSIVFLPLNSESFYNGMKEMFARETHL